MESNRERVLRLFAEGRTRGEIAREVGVTHQRVSQILLAHKINKAILK